VPALKPETSAGVIAPPPLIFLTGLGLGFALEALLPGSEVPAAVRWVLGPALLLLGLALALSFVRVFERAGTAVEPWKPTTAIVTGGPYRFSRNPGYLGMALTYVGIALLAGALWPLATLVPTLAVVNWGVIVREERYLERLFGEEYLTYKARVRRWI
jgi:protein-S-isoprenylcysteine O-methyltransferase Ste14